MGRVKPFDALKSLSWLAQEPFCFTPEEIANVTEFQLEHVYYIPAKKASDRAKNGDDPLDDWDEDEVDAEFDMWLAVQGKTREDVAGKLEDLS